MATLRFLLKRFVAQRLLGLAVVVTLAFSVAVLVAGPIYADAAREAILSSELAGAPPTVRNARLQVFGDQTFDWAAADEVITERTESLPVDRIVRQGLGTVRLGSPAGPSVPLLAREGIEEHLEIRGDPPGEDGILLHAGWPGTSASAGDRVDIIGPTGERDGARRDGHLQEPRSRRPLLVRFAEPVPGSGLDAAPARRRQPRHARPRDARAGAHDPVLVGRVPRPHGRAVRRRSQTSRIDRTRLHEPAGGGRARSEHRRPDLGTRHAPRHRAAADRRSRGADPVGRLPDRRRHARRAGRRRCARAHAAGIRARGPPQPRLPTRCAPRGPGDPGGVRRDRRVPARAAPRDGPRGARQHGERTRSSRRRLPDPPERDRSAARTRRRVRRCADPPGPLGPVRVADGARGAESRLPGGSSPARAGAGRAVRPSARGVRVPPVADRDAAGGRIRRARPA